jgi:hypothetical protein
MNKRLSPLGWTTLGAGLMYVFDPSYGKRRRALMRDKATRYLNKLGDAVDVTVRDVTNRSHGLLAETQTMLTNENVPDDIVLAERVRAELGFVVSHPHAIEVTANNGHVTVSGPILAREERALLDCVASVRGVRSVESRLEAHEQPDGVPGLQGGGAPRPSRFELLLGNWSPATRFVTSVLGGMLALAGLQRRNVAGRVFGMIGAGLLARGLTNIDRQRLLGTGSHRRAMAHRKTDSDISTQSRADDAPTSSALH